MEIIEINKNKRSIVKISDDERRLILDCLEIYKPKVGKDERYEIDKLKYMSLIRMRESVFQNSKHIQYERCFMR